jgi:uncharacterized protein YggU (UPF0235/DUF167 family)
MLEGYFISEGTENFKLYLKVKAAAKRNAIEGFQAIDNKYYLKISVQQIPEQGKANHAIISILSKLLNHPKSNFEIIQGASSSIKLLLIKKIDLNYLKTKFSPYID